MATLSKQEIDYSTRRYRQLGRVEDLSYDVTTTKGIKYRFKPTAKDLYVFMVEPKSSRYVFDRKVVDNLTDGGDDMYHISYNDDVTITGVQNQVETNFTGVTNEQSQIETIENSRKKFSQRDQIKADIVR